MCILVDSIVTATAEIFQTMLMMEVRTLSSEEAAGMAWDQSICAAIELEGLYRGSIEVLAPGPVAMEITGSFLGMPAEQLDDDVHDAIGELTNMLAGSLKLALSDHGKEIRLSVPDTRVVPGFTFVAQSGDGGVAVPFCMGSGEFLVKLLLTQTDESLER